MLFVTYNADSGALISVTDTPPTADPATCTRAISADSVELHTWDAHTRQFRDEAGVAERTLTGLQYMTRFTQAELETIYGLSDTNLAVRVWVKMFERADVVDLDDARTVTGLQQLEAAGILATGRAAEILS